MVAREGMSRMPRLRGRTSGLTVLLALTMLFTVVKLSGPGISNAFPTCRS